MSEHDHAHLDLWFTSPSRITRIASPTHGLAPARPTAISGTGVIALRDGQIVALLTLSVRAGRVDHIDGIVDPTKLEPIARALGF